jgi:hypothetical protein
MQSQQAHGEWRGEDGKGPHQAYHDAEAKGVNGES